MESLSYFQPPAEIAKTANYVITPAYVGSIFTNQGAAGEVDFTLPAGAPGLCFGFYTSDAHLMKILAAGADVIVLADLSGGTLQNSTPGYYAKLRWLAGKWVVLHATGEWDVS